MLKSSRLRKSLTSVTEDPSVVEIKDFPKQLNKRGKQQKRESTQQPTPKTQTPKKQLEDSKDQPPTSKQKAPQHFKVGPSPTQKLRKQNNGSKQFENDIQGMGRQRKRIVEETDSPSRNKLRGKFDFNKQSNVQQESSDTTVSCPASEPKSKVEANNAPSILQGARGRRLRKLMIEQKSSYANQVIRRKDIVDAPEVVEERNELIEKRCCICLEEMRAKTRPEECRHVFCRTCITAWTKTFSNLCPLCKVEIKWLLIYKEKQDPEDLEEQINDSEPQQDVVVDKIEVVKPVINNELSDWVESFADNCYVCLRGDNEPQLLVCDHCNFNICHTYCCNLDRIPDDDWFCRDCTNEMEEEQRRRQLREDRRRKSIQAKRKQTKIRSSDTDSDESEDMDEIEPHCDITSLLKKKSELYNESDEDGDDHEESRNQQVRSCFARKKQNISESLTSRSQFRKAEQTVVGEDTNKKYSSSSLEEHLDEPEDSDAKVTPQCKNSYKSRSRSRSVKPKDIGSRQFTRKNTFDQEPLQKKQQDHSQSVQYISSQSQSCQVQQIQQQSSKSLLTSFIPPFKTASFGTRITMNYNLPQSPVQLSSLNEKFQQHQQPFKQHKSCLKKTSKPCFAIDQEEIQIVKVTPSSKKPLLSFKDPTPQKSKMQQYHDKRMAQFLTEFDKLEAEADQIKPKISIQSKGTVSTSKATYFNLIETSNIIRTTPQKQQRPQQKKQRSEPSNSFSQPSTKYEQFKLVPKKRARKPQEEKKQQKKRKEESSYEEEQSEDEYSFLNDQSEKEEEVVQQRHQRSKSCAKDVKDSRRRKRKNQ